ncbi:TPA: D-alanyl-lipoteichoic acid biosynthesis protein DltB, partial [Streptococcus agalactiae]
MIQAFLEKLPHLDVYGNPQYFFYLILAVLPIYIGLFFKKRFALYEIIFSLSFIVMMLTGSTFNQLKSL